MNNFFNEIKETWEKSPLLLLTEILGTLMGITAGLAISIFTVSTPFLITFILYFLSSILLGFTAYKQRNSRLLVLNSVYTVINIIGIYNGFILFTS